MERVSEWILEQFRHLRRERDLAVLDVASAPVEVEAPAADDGDPVAPVLDLILARAAEEWARGIEEPASPRDQRGAPRIDIYIRSPQGLRWPSAELGPAARPNAPYVRDKQFPWCGAFAAFCFAAAGLRPHLRKKVMPSTYRLMQWARGTERWVKPEDLRPGDLCIVGPADGKRWPTSPSSPRWARRRWRPSRATPRTRAPTVSATRASSARCAPSPPATPAATG